MSAGDGGAALDIAGIDLPTLISELHRRARPVGMGALNHRPLGSRLAADLIKQYQQVHPPHGEDPMLYACDYVYGVPIKGRFTATRWIGWRLYDRDAGVGAARRIVDDLLAERSKP